MNNEQYLEEWINTLDVETLRKTLYDCVNHLIDTEDVRFYGDRAPYWQSCGDSIDGSELTDEEDFLPF